MAMILFIFAMQRDRLGGLIFGKVHFFQKPCDDKGLELGKS